MPVLSTLEHTVSLAAASPLSSTNDEATLVLAAQRDPLAFAHLYLRYVDAVYRYCHRRLRVKEAAEDATSLVFAKALAALPRYHAELGTFRAWLFAIAHNVVVDAQRAAKTTWTIDMAASHPA